MFHIGRKKPVALTVHYPETEEGRKALAEAVAQVHGEVVHDRIRRLDCPAKQKQEILDAVISIIQAGEQ